MKIDNYELKLHHAVEVISARNSRPYAYIPSDGKINIYENKYTESSRSEITSGVGRLGYGTSNTPASATGNKYSLRLYFQLPEGFYKYDSFSAALNFGNIETTEKSYHCKKGTNKGSGIYELNIESSESKTIKNKGIYGSPEADYNVMPSGTNLKHVDSGINVTSNQTFFENSMIIIETEQAQYLVVELNPTAFQAWAYTSEAGTQYVSCYAYLNRIQDVSQITLTCSNAREDYIAEPVYPVNAYVSNRKNAEFFWNLLTQSKKGNLYYVKRQLIYLMSNDWTQPIEISIDGNDTSKVIPVSTLASMFGASKWRIALWTNYNDYPDSDTGHYDYISEWYSFIVTGATGAPEITNVSQNSFPTITWSSSNQISWQMIIKNADGVAYDSGMMAGAEQNFKLPVMLSDGSYSIEMRTLNRFGIYSPWGSSSFNLAPEKPSKPENVFVSATNDYTISIKCNETNTGKYYAVRRKNANSKIEILGELNKGFTFYKAELNDSYEYAVRHYVTGYNDSEWLDGSVVAHGVVIRDAEDPDKYINAWIGENEIFNVYSNDSLSVVLRNCLGRPYPVKEDGEWITSKRSFNTSVTEAEFKILKNISNKGNTVILQNNSECMPCLFEMSDSGQHISGKHLVDIVLTRIDGD